jgi:benzodiazapine receptor
MPLFFGYGRPIAATADIVALTGVTGYMAYVWSKVDPMCGYLLVPYLFWLSFATYLTVSEGRERLREWRDRANLALKVGCGYLNNWDLKNAKTE